MARLALAVALWLGPALRSAEASDAEVPASVSLRWTAPDECPDDAQVLAAIEERLGEPLLRARVQPLLIRVHVVGTAGAYAAKLRFEGQSGVEERYLEHPDCQRLMEGAALVVALTVDPDRVSARQRSESSSAAQAPPPPTEPPQPPTVPSGGAVPAEARPRPAGEALPGPARPLRVVLSGAGTFGLGFLPRASLGVGVGLGLSRPHFSVGLVGRYWLARSEYVPGVANGQVEISLASFGLRACATPWLGSFRLSGCAGLDLGSLSGRGIEVENERTRDARFSALSAGVWVARPSEALVPFLGVEAGVPLARPPFGVQRDGAPLELFRPARVSALVSLGFGFEL